MTIKTRLLELLPGVRWTPHDIPSTDGTSKPKTRIRFSLRASSLVSSSAQGHHRPIKRRQSNISLTSIPDPALDARTLNQNQSMFFARLPLEIRRMVYEYLMEGETVHMTLSTKQKFGHFVCEGAKGSECTCKVMVGGKESQKLDRACSSLIRVCRRMYSETTPYLYNPHTFSLLHVTHLLYLPSRTPQQRLNSIRTLRLRWAIRALPYLCRPSDRRVAYLEDTKNWEKGWAILASLQGLRNLYVEVTDPSPHQIWEVNWLQYEALLLEPVKKVVQPRQFELVLPYAACDLGRDMGESRVILKAPPSDSRLEDDG